MTESQKMAMGELTEAIEALVAAKAEAAQNPRRLGKIKPADDRVQAAKALLKAALLASLPSPPVSP